MIKLTQQLAQQCQQLQFTAPVTHCYNPLIYAWVAHRRYLSQYATAPKKVIFVGINPGPWGMGQTGIPFGEVEQVKNWMGINEPIQSPPNPHPKRPVDGFACRRSEVSGRRLWQFFAHRYGSAQQFFSQHLVLNYCPLLFIDGSDNKARNLTPDKLKATERQQLFSYCDNYLKKVCQQLKPQYLIGIGQFAEQKLHHCFTHSATTPTIGRIIHPSPANPHSNKNFYNIAQQQLDAMGI